MKNNITEIIFILDRSGSMAGFEADTVGGFNATIEKQKKKDGKTLVSTVLFDNVSDVLHDRQDINDISPISTDDFTVGGCTALFDAIGDAIRHIGNIHKYARAEDVPEHTIFMITTDGMENSSCRYDRSTVKAMIERQQNKYGWEFIFLAANIDSEGTAQSIGIRRDRAVRYRQDKNGIQLTYDAMSEAITALRDGDGLDNACWRMKIDRDYRSK